MVKVMGLVVVVNEVKMMNSVVVIKVVKLTGLVVVVNEVKMMGFGGNGQSI